MINANQIEVKKEKIISETRKWGVVLVEETLPYLQMEQQENQDAFFY